MKILDTVWKNNCNYNLYLLIRCCVYAMAAAFVETISVRP